MYIQVYIPVGLELILGWVSTPSGLEAEHMLMGERGATLAGFVWIVASRDAELRCQVDGKRGNQYTHTTKAYE